MPPLFTEFSQLPCFSASFFTGIVMAEHRQQQHSIANDGNDQFGTCGANGRRRHCAGGTTDRHALDVNGQRGLLWLWRLWRLDQLYFVVAM